LKIEEIVNDLSPKQKEAVRTIFKALSVKSQKGMRCSNDWPRIGTDPLGAQIPPKFTYQ